MSMSDKIAAFLADRTQLNNKAVEGAANTTTITGIAAEDSENGSVRVIIPGADVIQPEDADGNQAGDNTVVVPIIGSAQAGDEITILGVGNGIADVPIVVGGAGSGDRMIKIAKEAQDAIDATNQHFYDDANGIHVVTEDGDDTTGPNLLANSLGILLRNGTLIMSAQTPSGFAVYDGLGNNAAHILAMLGDVITLGKNGEQQLVLDQNTFELLNDSGDPFFHVGYSDEAVGPGGSTITAPFILFDLTGTISSRTIGAYSVALGANVAAQAFGSAAFGNGTVADGATSMATGDHTTTKNPGEFACGTYNEIDTTTGKLFSVGDGGTENTRHDAFAVYAGGPVVAGGRELLAAEELYRNASGSFTGQITLNALVSDYKRIDIHYKDSDGNLGSTTIWKPTSSFTASCNTSTYFGSGFSNKARTMQFLEQAPTSTRVFTNGAGGEFVIDANGSRYQSGNLIGITAIIGYK